MKNRFLYTVVIAVATAVVSCGSDDESVPEMAYPTDCGTFVDVRDGFQYHWVRYGTLDWMVDNAHYYIDDEAYCRVYPVGAGNGHTDYTDRTNWQRFGCLYNVSGAQCACPDGWRLPTDEDWQQLERCFGMSESAARSYEWRGMIASNLLKASADSTSIHLQLGGYYTESWNNWSSHFREWSAVGYYWTSSADESSDNGLYFYRKLMWNQNGVYRQSTSPEDMFFSVRYVRDVKQE